MPTVNGARNRGREERGERGIVLVWFSLLLVVLLAMASFAVDVGSWYARAEQLQKAADAAALAGVAQMPDATKARDAAQTVAERNGFVDGQGGIKITYTPIPPRRYRVDILDPQVKRYFSQVLTSDPLTIRRAGTAEYALPVPLGSPENSFGTGDQDLAAGPPRTSGPRSAAFALRRRTAIATSAATTASAPTGTTRARTPTTR